MTTAPPHAAPTERLTPYPDLSIGDYHAMAHVSPSRLKVLAKSPFHYKRHYLTPGRLIKPPSQDQINGSALHILAVQPELWSSEVAIRPEINPRTNSGKDELAKFKINNADRLILSSKDEQDVRGMAAGIAAHRAASHLLALPGCVELSYTFVWEKLIACKTRPDFHTLDRRIIVDIKSTSSGVDRESFSRTIHKWDYHVQAAWNLDALGAEQFIWIAVESDWPHAVAVHPASANLLDAGRRRITTAMATLAECTRTNHWPGPAGDLIAEPIDLPGWCRD